VETSTTISAMRLSGVPFIPGGEPSGSVSSAASNSFDLFATAAPRGESDGQPDLERQDRRAPRLSAGEALSPLPVFGKVMRR
jgi:hypothetical protein